MRIRSSLLFCASLSLVFAAGFCGSALAAANHDAEAIRLNNNGVALMNQQQNERAEAAFSQAFAKDKTLAEAALNDGIALLYLQKLTEAEAALKRAQVLAPGNPRVWYNLGLVQRAANDVSAALASFQRAVELDPSDADSLYFEGVCLQDQKQFPQAIAVFTKALDRNPQHASSEFALARALQRSGRADDAKPHFVRFQHLTSTKIASALGLSYGDQGRYSTAVAVNEQRKAQSAMISVHFTRQLFIAGAASRDAERSSGGACVMDVEGDGIYDLVLMESGPQAIRVLRSHGDGHFEEFAAEKAGLGLSGHAVSCAVGDFDGDGLPDLAVALEDRLVLFHNLGHGRFEDVTQAAGIAPRNRPEGITFVDYDHDGDLDLFVTGSPLQAGSASNVLWRNNGNKTFTEWTESAGLGGGGHTRAALLSDVNNDRAVDLVVAGDGSAPTVYLNPREGKFNVEPFAAAGGAANSVGVAALDFDKDGWMDLVVTQSIAPGLSLWRNKDGKSFEPVALPMRDATAAWGVTPIDFDNDGWVDFAAVVETKHGAEVRVFRNLGDGGFEDVSKSLGLDHIELKDPRALIAMDVNGDGAADLIVTSASGEPVWLKNEGGNRNHSVRIKLTGFADNKTAIGVKVEAYSRDNWQKWEIAGASGYLSQGPPEVLIGLGDADGVDLLRLLWPTGVPQDEINVARKPVVDYTEADRRGSSCPVLFAWDGKHYGLVTDTIGAAVVGHWFTPERRNIPRADEWIKVEGSQLAETNGRLSLRFAEPMEEVNYIDQLRLRAIDHPEGTEVYPDERFLDDPPFASGGVVVSGAARLPAGVWDSEGRNVLSLLAARDHKFVSDFTKLPYDGFAKEHSLELELGSVRRDAPLRLLLTGYVEYFSATSLYSAWQAGIAPVSPYVEAQLADGSWQRIDKEMGFPAGLERTIVVDLSGKLPVGAHRIRIMTNLQIYWDQILVDDGPNQKAAVHETEIPLAQARLRFHGYPRQIEGASPGDLSYNYDEVSLTGPFQRQRGSYTRLGDVTPLLNAVDDQFAIFGSGEEIAAEFDAGALPPLPPHWKRDYFFYANGYVKDMDFYDASPFTVSQLPFHQMSTYPYPQSESYPADRKAIEYQLDWNDRFDSGEPAHSFLFDYRLWPSTPSDTALSPITKAGAHE
ncbi:FG-GAP-like repeat-containing protein [Acidicapsa acidisoli]|uniref:FG-GAP-like repeat-containing protein n=1 Tax=Acidicapsa acidisoli TaxID=1615681 RepID=UPI0021E018F2|nr:FG-GAP-like repeat-containing protein [Acidicapsa acidisoli]